MEDTTKLSVREPSAMISEAVAKGANLEQLEKLLSLQERWEANEAKKLYNKAMVSAQEEIPSVVKTKKNDQTHSKYADLGNIISQTKKVYTKHGFSVSFYEGDTTKENHVRICADVVHASGHKETYHYDVPLDGVGIKGNANMTAIHGKASSTSYAQRYLMCMIWNIPTADNDAQGIGVAVECIDEKQKSELVDLMASKGTKIDRFCKAYGIEDLSKLPKASFDKAKQDISVGKVQVKK